jgi:hypothetical protein
MAEYRAYIVGDDEHFVSVRAFVCDSDADATVWAKQLVDGHDVELWSGERFVLRLEAKQESRTDRAREVAREYADDQREIIKKLQK